MIEYRRWKIMLDIGNINQLKVNRKTDIGYILTKGNDEVFLHINESYHRLLAPGDMVDAFLYFDGQNRLAATLAKPLITTLSHAFITVKDINHKLGIFLDMGISKDLLLSKDDLPNDTSLWPLVGEKLMTTVVYKNRLRAKLLFHELKTMEEPFLTSEDEVDAIVHKISESGLNLLTKNLDSIFVHHSQVRVKPRIGEVVRVRILTQTERGYTASINPFKEKLMIADADQILSYLLEHKTMDLDANSQPEDILTLFNMSKKAFKRALGNLYKKRFVEFREGKTILVKK